MSSSRVWRIIGIRFVSRLSRERLDKPTRRFLEARAPGVPFDRERAGGAGSPPAPLAESVELDVGWVSQVPVWQPLCGRGRSASKEGDALT